METPTIDGLSCDGYAEKIAKASMIDGIVWDSYDEEEEIFNDIFNMLAGIEDKGNEKDVDDNGDG